MSQSSPPLADDLESSAEGSPRLRDSEPEDGGRRKAQRYNRLRTFLALALTAILAAMVSIAAVLWHLEQGLPDLEKLVDYQPAPDRPFAPISTVPEIVIHAFLSAEDADFYSHPGINLIMILRAAAVDVVRLVSNERPIGASTITQQLVKNFLLTDEVSVARKIREALLAVRLERRLSKDRILEIYLNTVYLGCGARGVSQAALNYFDKSLGALSLDQAAFLAALPKAPSHYNPLRFPRSAKRRRNWVLQQMLENGYLSRDGASTARAKPIRLAAHACLEGSSSHSLISETAEPAPQHASESR